MKRQELVRLVKQVELLAQKIEGFPRMIDDELIVETLSAPSEYPDLVPDVLDRLCTLIAPAFLASHETGMKAWYFCAIRGIALPAAVGELDRVSRPLALNRAALDLPTEPDRSFWGGDGELDETSSPGLTTVSGMRRYLVQLLMKYQNAAAVLSTRVRRSETGLPILNNQESGRLLRLVEPLQVAPDLDLPLLVWKDDNDGGVRTSWPEGHEGWTPVDVGMSMPGYLLLARPNSGRSHDLDRADDDIGQLESTRSSDPRVVDGGSSILKRRILANSEPRIPDDEIIQCLEAKFRVFGTALEATQSLYLEIERTLLASVLAGAVLVRAARELERRSFDVTGPVSHAASIVSYPGVSDMPEAVATNSWLMPGTPAYESMTFYLVAGLHENAELRNLLVFYLFERHAIRDLQGHRFTVEDIPILDAVEGKRLRKLVDPLEGSSQGDLPLLVWREGNESIMTSRGGQSWTNVDTRSGSWVERVFENPDPWLGGREIPKPHRV